MGPCSSDPWRRWNQWSAPLDMYASNSAMMSWYSAMNAGLSSSWDQSTGPDRTGTGLRYRAQPLASIRENRIRARGCQLHHML